jgi:hypothetical protein
MGIPSGGLIHKYDLLDPACYVHPGTIYDLVGTSDLLVNGSPTYDAILGCLTWNGLGIGAYSLPGQMANITSTFTFSTWFKLNDGSVTQCVFNNGERTSSWSGYSLFKDAANAKLDFGANFVWGGYHGSPDLDPAKWYNATYTFSGGTLNFYLNGTLVGTSTGLGSPLAYGPNAYMAWGGNATAGFGAPQFQNKASYGVVLYYNTALTGPQVLDIYNEYYLRFNPGKVYLNASEPASAVAPYTTWSDLSNSYDFTMYSPSFTAATSSTPAYYSFPSRDYTTPVSVYGEYNGTPAVTATNNFTGYFWVRRNADHGSYTQNRLSIFANGREDLVGGDNGWSYGAYNNPNAANNNVTIERANYGVIDSGYTFANATWINIAYTVDGSNVLTFYQDGIIKGGPGFSWGATSPADGMWISRTAGSYFSWMGDISIIRQYDTALTQAQIQELYNYDLATYISPSPPPAPAGNVGGRTFGQGFAG